MPYARKRKYRSRSRRRFKPMRRRFSVRKRRYRRGKGYNPLRKRQRVTMTYYAESIELNPNAVGLCANHIFSANGCYDPDVTGIGHQPLAFDQMMLMYDHGTVFKAYITATFHNTDNVNPQWAYISTTDNVTPTTDRTLQMENGHLKRVMLGQNGTASASKTIVTSVNPNKYLGVKNPMDNPELKFDVGDNPSEQVYFHVGVCPIETVDSSPVNVTVSIKYICVMTEPKKLPLS